MVVPQKNELILVASAISYSFPSSSPIENRKRSIYPSTQTPPSSLEPRNRDEEIQQTIRKYLMELFRGSQKITLVLGIYLLHEDATTGKISFNFWSKSTFFVFLRVFLIVFVGYLFLTYSDSYGAIFGGWGETERFSHVLSVVTILICDSIFTFFSFRDVKNMTVFYANLYNFIFETTTLAVSTLGGIGGGSGHERRMILAQYIKRLKSIQWSIDRKVYVIVVCSVLAYACSIVPAWILASTLQETEELDTVLLFGLPILNLVYVSLHNLRQVVYYAPIGALKSIWFSLSVLNDLVSYEVTSKDDDEDDGKKGKKKEERISKLLEQFQTVYDLVEDVNVRFQWILITGSISLLVTITCSAFEFCTWSAAGGILPVVVSLSCVLSNAMTFYEICAASSDVTREAKACMTLLRDVGPSVAHNRELFHKITMWHMEGTIQPPTISPGYFFTLRRRVLPPIVAMLITYLLVLVQFNLKDTENGSGEKDDVLEILRNHSLIAAYEN
ncbi:unnamed protein product [Orchesella dallaii]|uniref:Gustatory receptor n=1 Tax=Orchesella dallaii TaxID=48710 RepID=A0ABP1R6U4_9HEXA